MTDPDVKVDLDEYTDILNSLNNEIAAYGLERRSLNEISSALKKIHASNEAVFSGVEATIKMGSSVLQELHDLRLSSLQGDIDKRYEKHEQSLKSVSETMQQIVHEQQRSALEMLQSSQHNKQALEQYAESVNVISSAQEASQERIIQQLDSLVSDLGSLKTTAASTEKQLQMLRTLVIVALVLIVAVGVAVIAI